MHVIAHCMSVDHHDDGAIDNIFVFTSKQTRTGMQSHQQLPYVLICTNHTISMLCGQAHMS